MNLKHFLDKEQYFERFSTLDRESRKCTTSVCRREFEDSVKPLNAIEKALVQRTCREALAMIPSGSKLAAIISFQPDNALTFDGGDYELPHTHGNVILFPKRFVRQSPKTIIHEAIHIYQRYHPLETNILLQKIWGMKMIALRPMNASHDWRSNPDTNDIVYADKNGHIITSRMNPNGYKLYDSRDHPYEIMAYRLADDIHDASATGPTLDWIEKYLYGN
jgi:hypothetical protein